MPTERFKGKTAVITGGASGIGWATAQRLAAERADTIIIVDNNEALSKQAVKRLQAMGTRAFRLNVDLSDYKSITALGARVSSLAEAVDVLINNAGIDIGGTRMEAVDPERIDQGLAVNMKAPFFVTRVLLDLLKKRGASVVNVSSAGATMGRQNYFYDASKAALLSLSRAMAIELCPWQIRVNAIAPGWTVTEFHFGHGENAATKKQQLENKKISGCLMQRIGRPEEIAAAIAFLASDDASYMTGTTLCVDGGRTDIDLSGIASQR